MRIINKAKYNCHTEPLFLLCKILPIEDLILQQKLVFMHALFYSYSVVYYLQFISNQNANDHRFTLRNDSDFNVTRTSLSIKMPLMDFPRAWNCMDQSLKDIQSKILFKKSLKLELLDKYCNFRCSRTICVSCMDV